MLQFIDGRTSKEKIEDIQIKIKKMEKPEAIKGFWTYKGRQGVETSQTFDEEMAKEYGHFYVYFSEDGRHIGEKTEQLTLLVRKNTNIRNNIKALQEQLKNLEAEVEAETKPEVEVDEYGNDLSQLDKDDRLWG